MIRLRVKEIAERQKVSQNRLSRLANIDANAVRRIWHNPEQNIMLDTLNRLAYALQVDAHELFEYLPDEKAPWLATSPEDQEEA